MFLRAGVILDYLVLSYFCSSLPHVGYGGNEYELKSLYESNWQFPSLPLFTLIPVQSPLDY